MKKQLLKNFSYTAIIIAITQVWACTNNPTPDSSINDQALWEKASIYLQALPQKDTLTLSGKRQAVIVLGKKLFFDKNLSINRNQSCNSCHKLSTYGVDNLMFSEGSNSDLGTRNTPTVFNACEQYAQFWDARASDLEAQASVPLFNKHEMGMSTPAFLIKRLQEDASYATSFTVAFPDTIPNMNLENIVSALASFENELITPSRFDDYLRGNLKALSTNEKNGLDLFIDAGCIPCHGGSTIGGQLPQLFPLYGQLSDYIPLADTDTLNSSGKMLLKVPSLRNVAKTAPYFHNGSVNSLFDAVDIMAKSQTNTALSTEDIADITAFLEALTGEIPAIALDNY
jgi:cytochrome c peroxidase